MIPFNYHHLYYFKVIATEGSISKAAEKLRIGQPALSMQLKQFEEQIGQALFERKKRSLYLNEMGSMVLGYANEIFRLGEEMLDAVHDRPVSKKMRLQVGALDSVPKFLVRALMGEAYKIQDCQISILEGEGPDLVESLLHHQLDLVLSNVSAQSLSHEKVFSRSLMRLPLIIVGSPKYSWMQAEFPKSLPIAPFILPTSHNPIRKEIEHWFETHSLKPNVIAETQDTSLLKSLAVEGHGVIAISEASVRGAISENMLIKLGELEGVYEEIWLISASRKIPNPIAEQLMKSFNFDLSRIPKEKTKSGHSV